MTVQTSPELSTSEIRTLALASAGGALEFYDFVIFVFFTSVIGKLFFAASLPDWVRQTQTFGIFAAGYLARPLGGIVIAHFGDTHGRKRMFTFSVLLMAVPTLLMGLLPTYQSIGVAAPLLLALCRFGQGLGLGGEWGGAAFDPETAELKGAVIDPAQASPHDRWPAFGIARTVMERVGIAALGGAVTDAVIFEAVGVPGISIFRWTDAA